MITLEQIAKIKELLEGLALVIPTHRRDELIMVLDNLSIVEQAILSQGGE